MILVVSDLHLGKSDQRDKTSLTELKDCINHYSPELRHVIFLGDTFDAFIEYPKYIPAAVNQWTDFVRGFQASGLTITYVAGNHDRWHRGYIKGVLGREVQREAFQLNLGRHRISFEHGDRADSVSPLVRFARSVSDSKLMLKLFTAFLPFGGGQWIASQVSRRFAGFEPNRKTVKALEIHAEKLLQSDSCNVVVMGHCHQASFSRSENGTYINTGDWFEGRTFALIGSEANPRLVLAKWTGESSKILSEELFSSI